MEWYWILLIVFAVVQFVGSMAVIAEGTNGSGFAFSYKAMKSFHHLTVFGAIVSLIFMILIIPYVYIIALLYLAFKGEFPEWFE